MNAPGQQNNKIALWLIIICAMVAGMVVLGGVVRLTGSGLSMVDWRPITGILPPLNDTEWQRVFAAYQASPEYLKVNFGMTLDDFKAIFWFEYTHRLLGRFIGIAFAVPFLYFLARGAISRDLGWKLAVGFMLGGLQGVLGWYMVKSGLVDRPDVSHLRLTAHLGLAVLIYAYLLWLAIDLLAPRRGKLSGALVVLAALVYLQILLGGLVAGLDAGRAYNTWPLMAGTFLPPEALSIAPWYLNLLENTAMVQFQHRLMAYVIAAFSIVLWCRRRGESPSLAWLAVFVLGQGVVGISALLAAVPVGLGAAHQAGGLAVLTVALGLLHHHKREGKEKTR